MPKTSDSTGAERLTVTVTSHDSAHVITVCGEIDYETGGRLRETLLTRAVGPSPRLVVDMSAVSFMDSAGLNVLLATYRKATDSGGWLRLAGTEAGVLRVLQIVGVDTILDLFPTVPAALV